MRSDRDVPWWAVSLLDIPTRTDLSRVRFMAQRGYLRQIHSSKDLEAIWQEVVAQSLKVEEKRSLAEWVEYAPELCRFAALDSPRAFCQFTNLLDDTLKVPFLADFHVRAVRYMRQMPESLILLPFGHGKLVAANTQICTPGGWRKHGDLAVGDLVYGPDGMPTPVIEVGPDDKASLRVTFSDGESIDVHPAHEWRVFNRGRQRYEVRETADLAAQRYMSGGRPLFQVDYTAPLEGEQVGLPMDPYALGVWLGDGSSAKGAVTHHPDDQYVLPYAVSSVSVHATTAIHTTHYAGLMVDLRATGVLNAKHVPEVYLRASRQQRWDLLSGLIDTDGCVDDKSIRFVNTNLRLIEAVEELARSFGYRTGRSEQQAALSSSGVQGRRTVYTVHFVPRDGQIPTRLHRKRDLHGLKQHRWTRRGIVSITPIEPVPGNCIQVARQDGMYLVGETLIPTHNSWISSMLVCFMDWAEEPEFTEGRIYYNKAFSDNYSKKLMGEIERNASMRALFPWIRRPIKPNALKGIKGDPCWQIWSTRGFSIGGKQAIEPSFEPLTVSAGVTGRRYWRAGCDDWVNSDNGPSEVIQEKMWNYFHTGPKTMGRVVPDWRSHHGTRAGTLFTVGTLFHRRDVNYRLQQEYRKEGKPVMRVDVYVDKEKTQVIWPEERPLEYIHELERSLGSVAFNMRCRNRIQETDEIAFSEDKVNGAIERGKAWEFGNPPPNTPILIGFDPASGKRTRYAKFPAVVVLAFSGDTIHVVEWARWSYPQPKQIDLLAELSDKYNSPVAIEDASQQINYRYWMEERHPRVRVITHTTKDNKRDWAQGVESFIPFFESNNIIIHSHNAPMAIVAAIREELISYPQGRYTDLVMAMWVAKYQYQLAQSRFSGRFFQDKSPAFRRGNSTVIDLRVLRERQYGEVS